jgi:hypothetical protein
VKQVSKIKGYIYKLVDTRRTIKQVGLVPFWCAVVDFVFVELFVSHFFVQFNGFDIEFLWQQREVRGVMLPVNIIFGNGGRGRKGASEILCRPNAAIARTFSGSRPNCLVKYEGRCRL